MKAITQHFVFVICAFGFMLIMQNGCSELREDTAVVQAGVSVGEVLQPEGPVLYDFSPLMGQGSPVQGIPDDRGNFRSGQLTAKQLRKVLSTGLIRTVIRMNGDRGDDRGPLSTKEEQRICAKYKVCYVTSGQLNHFDGHAGYEKGRGYVGAYAGAEPYLRSGGTLIHCRWNVHRTGTIVGAWLASLGYDLEQIIRLNRWQDLAQRPEECPRCWETVRSQLNSKDHDVHLPLRKQPPAQGGVRQ